MAVRRSPKPIRDDDLDTALRKLVEDGAKAGKEAEAAALRAGAEARTIAGKPDIDEALVTRLKSALEDEVVVAKSAVGESSIQQQDTEIEIAKRALANLKLPQLRSIAESIGVAPAGTLDHVAERIVRAFNADQSEIARLVVTYETEPSPDRKFTSRLFVLRDAPSNPAELKERLQRFKDRYVRTGIAKWLVLSEVKTSADWLSMAGVFRSYKADAEKTDDDEFSLRAVEDSADVRLQVKEGQPFAEIEAKGTTESHAVLAVFSEITGCAPLEDLPIPSLATEGELMHWDPYSVFLVWLLQSNFKSNEIQVFNLTMAGFETGEPVDTDDETTQPRVRSVRFQGAHLLDSRTSCELLVAGQRLVSLGMMVRFRTDRDNDFLLPLTVRLTRNHVIVDTPFGANPPTAARSLHNAVLRGVRIALATFPEADLSPIHTLAKEIRNRSEQDEPVRRATLFTARRDSGASTASE